MSKAVINKEEAEQIVFNICGPNICDQVLERINQAFDLAEADEISLSTLKQNLKLILSQDIDTHRSLNAEYEEIGQRFNDLYCQIKDENDPVNVILASSDFAAGYPKHCINKCSEPLFGFRFFAENSTREQFLLREPDDNYEVDKNLS